MLQFFADDGGGDARQNGADKVIYYSFNRRGHKHCESVWKGDQ